MRLTKNAAEYFRLCFSLLNNRVCKVAVDRIKRILTVCLPHGSKPPTHMNFWTSPAFHGTHRIRYAHKARRTDASYHTAPIYE